MTDQAQLRQCPWCSELVPPDALDCTACGAPLAGRESLGGVVVPGVTEVDPDLIEERPYPMIRTFSTAKGGTLTIMGRPPGPPEPAPDPATLGQPSQAALDMLDKLKNRPAGDSRTADQGQGHKTPGGQPAGESG